MPSNRCVLSVFDLLFVSLLFAFVGFICCLLFARLPFYVVLCVCVCRHNLNTNGMRVSCFGKCTRTPVCFVCRSCFLFVCLLCFLFVCAHVCCLLCVAKALLDTIYAPWSKNDELLLFSWIRFVDCFRWIRTFCLFQFVFCRTWDCLKNQLLCVSFVSHKPFVTLRTDTCFGVFRVVIIELNIEYRDSTSFIFQFTEKDAQPWRGMTKTQNCNTKIHKRVNTEVNEKHRYALRTVWHALLDTNSWKFRKGYRSALRRLIFAWVPDLHFHVDYQS